MGDVVTMDHGSFPDGNNPRTISGWVNAASLNNFNHVFGYGDFGSNHASFSLLINSNNQVIMNVGGGHGPDSAAVAGATVATATWTWVAVTNNGDNVSVTVNGNAAATASIGHGISTDVSAGDFTLGDSDHSYPFTGALDEIRVSSVARSADWLNAEYATMANTFLDVRPEEVQ
jgi:hypothetical protein